jgi:uncharacterized tellurite resistance protein B-like protein
MSIKEFSPSEQQAAVDLLTLAMYADGHLASVEDQRIRRVMEEFGLSTEYDRNQFYDQSVARVREHLQSGEAARAHAGSLAQAFSRPERREAVRKLIADVVSSDGRVEAQESTFLLIATKALE